MIRTEIYLAKLKGARLEYPNAHFEVITSRSSSPLKPSRDLLIKAGIMKNKNGFYAPLMPFEEYSSLLVEELENNEEAMERIKELKLIARNKLVFLVCYEKDPQKCHRSVVRKMIEYFRFSEQELQEAKLFYFLPKWKDPLVSGAKPQTIRSSSVKRQLVKEGDIVEIIIIDNGQEEFLYKAEITGIYPFSIKDMPLELNHASKVKSPIEKYNWEQFAKRDGFNNYTQLLFYLLNHKSNKDEFITFEFRRIPK